MSALSSRQKWVLVQIARRAFNKRGAELRGIRDERQLSPTSTLQDALEALALNGSEGCFETWRHEQVKLACGKGGLRLCSQLDYKAVEAHFQQLLGEDGRAFAADQRHQSEPRRQAESVLVKACERWGFHLSYAEAICRNKFKVSLDEAEPAVIWKVVYTVNSRGAKKKRDANFTNQREGVMA